MKGVIQRFFPEKGFGFIRMENNDSLFFHRSALQPDHNPEVNDQVEFQIKATHRGDQAEHIKLIQAGEPVQYIEEYPNKVLYSHDGGFPAGFSVAREVATVRASEYGYANARNALLAQASRAGGNGVVIQQETQSTSKSSIALTVLGFVIFLMALLVNFIGMLTRPTMGKFFYTPKLYGSLRTRTTLVGVAVVVSRQRRQ